MIAKKSLSCHVLESDIESYFFLTVPELHSHTEEEPQDSLEGSWYVLGLHLSSPTNHSPGIHDCTTCHKMWKKKFATRVFGKIGVNTESPKLALQRVWGMWKNSCKYYFLNCCRILRIDFKTIRGNAYSEVWQLNSNHDWLQWIQILFYNNFLQVSFLFGDRGTPDGYRHMNGYGSHTFKLINDKGEAVYCKFHFKVFVLVLHVFGWKA